MELTIEQILLLGVLSSLIIQLIKVIWIGLLKRPKPSEGDMRWIAFIISIPVAYFWSGVELPPFGEDPMAFAIALITSASGVFLFAHLVYDVILSNLLEFVDSRVLKRKALAQ